MAFVAAPLVGALALASFGPLYAGLSNMVERVASTAVLFAVFYAYPATALLGVPAFLVLRGRFAASPFNCAVAGALVAALPMFAIGMLSGPDYAFSNGHVTHQDGARTLDGWIDLLAFSGRLAAIGAVTGIVFWAIAAAGATRRNANLGLDEKA